MAYPVTQERLKELFDYDSRGFLVRLVRTGPTTFVGQRVYGSAKADGYFTVFFDGKMQYIHRVIFAWHYGYWPSIVDHIDRDKSNNAIENLREASATDSALNRGPRKSSPTQVAGVYHNNNGRICARIKRNGKRVWLGVFETIDQAAQAIKDYDLGLPR